MPVWLALLRNHLVGSIRALLPESKEVGKSENVSVGTPPSESPSPRHPGNASFRVLPDAYGCPFLRPDAAHKLSANTGKGSNINSKTPEE